MSHFAFLWQNFGLGLHIKLLVVLKTRGVNVLHETNLKLNFWFAS